jgi:transposase
MLRDFAGAEHIYVACGYTDLRKSIDGLALLVQKSFQLDPFGRSLFLFCGKRRDRIKALYWEGDGFVLLYKRLESGSFQWPRTQEQVRQVSAQQFRWLMEGLCMDQPKALKRYDNVALG